MTTETMSNRRRRVNRTERPDGFRLRSFTEDECRYLPKIRVGGQRLHVDMAGVIHRGRLWPIGVPPRPAGIAIARRWLREAQLIKTCNWGSYGLKHVVELWAREYVSNGEFVTACYREGVSLEQERFGGSLNLVVGIGTRWLRSRPESRVLGLWKPTPSYADLSEWVA